jgi:glycosyltransferase involved in cell wall biosynthesis
MRAHTIEHTQDDSSQPQAAVPAISAVINTYNHKGYIGKAIRSILSQTLLPDEIIVIDDGSTDGSEEYVRQEFGDRVLYFYQEERGIGASRNAAIRVARGAWIAFLDSDDYWAPEKLEMQMSAARNQPRAVMVTCIGRECTPDGTILGELGLPRPFTMETVRAELRRRCIFCSSGLLIRRDVLAKVGGFPEDLMFGEDLVTFAKVAADHEIIAVDQPLFYKTQLPRGLSSRPDAVLRDGLISFRRCKEALARRSGAGRWFDAIAFRQSEAQLYIHTAWLYAARKERGKAVRFITRGLIHWPFLTVWQYRSLYWLGAKLVKERG